MSILDQIASEIYSNDFDESKFKFKIDLKKFHTEIFEKLCTNGRYQYSNFVKFLKEENVFDEESYNKVKLKNDWLDDLINIRNKYKKFNFRDLHSNNFKYYWNKIDCDNAYNIAKKQIKDMRKFRKLLPSKKLKLINEIDNKIPIINFEYYYPKD